MYEPPHRFWGSSPGPPEEQPVLATTEPYLWPSGVYLKEVFFNALILYIYGGGEGERVCVCMNVGVYAPVKK